MDEHESSPTSPVNTASPAPKSPAAAAHADGGQWKGAFSAIGDSLNQILKNPQPAILILAAYAAATAASYYLAPSEQVAASMESGPMQILIETLQSLVPIVIFSVIFLLALPRYALAIADKRGLRLGELMRFDSRRYFSVLIVSFLASSIIGAFAMFFLIPAIWAIAWFTLSTYPAADVGDGPIKSLQESYRLSKDHIGKVWGIYGAAIAIWLLMFIPIIILSFLGVVGEIIGSVIVMVVGLAVYGAFALLYRWLQHATPDTLHSDEAPTSPANVQ